MEFLYNLKDLLLYDKAHPMIFNSGAFFMLFTLFIMIYTIIHKHRIAVSIYVIAFSVFFYYKSSGWYFFILVFTAISDFVFAIAISKTKKLFLKRIWLTLSLGTSLGLLAYFKYTNFFLENFAAIINNNFSPLDIFLPIGISFYTFQSVSYVLDVYWGKLKPTYRFLDYAFFLSFFPQLVAGPIVKAHHFLPQLTKRIKITKEAVYAGLWLLMLGLFKKAIIADYISQYNDLIFAAPTNYNGFENLMAMLGYTLQIYCDFSGYSDMAIGLGKIMGFDLGINFNFPYQARNITDFWRRWHISLSSWLRDYVYIPLGGNRKGKRRMYINLFITMLVGGLWHGANWKFVFWGAMHGVGLAVHKASQKVLGKIPDNAFFISISWFFTFVFVIFLWIFFRAADIKDEAYSLDYNKNNITNIVTKTSVNNQNGNKTVKIELYKNNELTKTINQEIENSSDRKLIINIKETDDGNKIEVLRLQKGFDVAVDMLKTVATDTNFKFIVPFWKARYIWLILVIIGFVMHTIPQNWNEKLINMYIKSPYILKIIMFVLLVQLVIQFKLEDVQPFIYFQF